MRDRWPTPVGCRGGFPALGVLLGSLFRVERPLRLGFVLGSASFRASCLGFRFRAWCLVPASCLVPFLLLGAWPGYARHPVGLGASAASAWPFRSAGGFPLIERWFLVPAFGSGPVFRSLTVRSASVFPQSFPQPVDNFSAGSWLRLGASAFRVFVGAGFSVLGSVASKMARCGPSGS